MRFDLRRMSKFLTVVPQVVVVFGILNSESANANEAPSCSGVFHEVKQGAYSLNFKSLMDEIVSEYSVLLSELKQSKPDSY